MPTVLDYARAQDPALKNVPDAQLAAYIKDQFPELAASLPTETHPLFSGAVQPTTAGTGGEVSKRAAQQLRSINIEQQGATMQNEIGTAKGKAWGDIGKGVVLGAAALGTGGLGVAPAMGLMGAAGIGAGTLDETLKAQFGSTDIPKTPKALATKLGLEGALSAGGEGVARALGYGIKYLHQEAFPALVMRSAAKAEQGQQALVRVQQDSFSQLRDFVRQKGNPTVDIGDNIVEFFNKLRERATGSSKTFKEATKPVFAKLWTAAEGSGQSLEKQPIDALMETMTDLNHIAYKTKSGMNSDELVALRDLADQVNKKITNQLETLGGDAATKVWGNYKAFTEQIAKDGAALKMAETGSKKLLGILGEIPLVGPSAAAGLDVAIRGKVSPWILERLYSQKNTADMVRKAIDLQSIGAEAQAQRIFDAAINTSGVGTLLKDWSKPEKRAEVKKAAANAVSLMPGPMTIPQ